MSRKPRGTSSASAKESSKSKKRRKPAEQPKIAVHGDSIFIKPVNLISDKDEEKNNRPSDEEIAEALDSTEATLRLVNKYSLTLKDLRGLLTQDIVLQIVAATSSFRVIN